MGLEVETVEAGERRKPVADYVLRTRRRRALGRVAADAPRRTERDDHAAVHRVARRQDGGRIGKLVPPPDVLEAELEQRIESKVREAITERILREAGFDVRSPPRSPRSRSRRCRSRRASSNCSSEKPDAEWRDHIEAVATELTDAADEAAA